MPATDSDVVDIDDDYDIIPASHLPGELQVLTDQPVPRHRAIVQLANDAKISPPMRRFGGRFWGCRRKDLPELARLLGLPREQPTTPPAPHRHADTSRNAAA